LKIHRVLYKILFYIILGLTPLLYFPVKPYLPAFQSNPFLYDLLYLIPYILFILSAVLGLRINQTRIFFIMILWLLIYFIISNPSFALLDKHNLGQFSKLLSLILPFMIMLIFLFNEDHILGTGSLIRSLSIILLLILAIWASISRPQFLNKFIVFNKVLRFENWALPDLLWLPFSGIIILFFMPNLKERSIIPFKIAVAISLIPLLLVLNTISIRTMNSEIKVFISISFTFIAILSLYTIYRVYWEKAYIDELTVLPNRRAFNEQLKKLGKNYTIAMIDIDHFKNFNDTYGHTEGDNVLRFIAKHIKDRIKGSVFRYGGEEFSVLFKRGRINEVYWQLDRMRQKLALKDFYIRLPEKDRKNKSEQDRGKRSSKTKKVKLTVSIGMAQKTVNLKNVEEVIKKADKALYDAKNKGRNRCVKFSN
jgi:diguanylate cyclase (GGDEF)-like protein